MNGGRANELPRPLDLGERVRDGQGEIDIEATAAERVAIAARLGLLELKALSAVLHVEPDEPEGVRLSGVLSAVAVQSCVVTLEPVETVLEEPVDFRFLPASAMPPPAEALDPDAPDPPEPLPASGIIEVGELLVQQLAVALDPYPRKPGASFRQEGPADKGDGGPFAKLAVLKGGQKA